MAALTVMSTSTMHPGPSWDETIVPALRKRLESESHTLSRRMSSLSAEGVSPTHYGPKLATEQQSRPRNPNAQSSSARSHEQSSITLPRSSLQLDPVPGSSSRMSDNTTPTFPAAPTATRRTSVRRSRTYSQPYTLNSVAPQQEKNRQRYHQEQRPNMALANGDTNLPTPISSRPTSPNYTPRTSDVVKPTRIPKVSRGRTPSQSSHGHYQPSSYRQSGSSSSGNGHGPYTPPTPDPSPELWVVEGGRQYARNNTVNSFVDAGPNGIAIKHEQPPFEPGSRSSSVAHSHEDLSDSKRPSRLSDDSAEGPFEHWYRGEVSRNGGVGELKVGKRMEMLDIANYGHSLKKRQKVEERDHPLVAGGGRRRRRRADSVFGIGKRESIFLDDERARAVARVLDESPLTDLDVETDPSESSHQSHFSHRQPCSSMNGRSSPEGMSTSVHEKSFDYGYRPSGGRSTTPNGRLRTPPPSKIPLPHVRKSSETPTHNHVQASSGSLSSTPVTSHIQRGASEPPNMHSAAGISLPSTPVQPGASPKSNRGKSPGASANHRSKATAMKLAEKKALEEKEKLAKRQSVAYYPTPTGEGEDMANAIPSWTEPVPRSGNWDEVVLPVVARKKGLDGQYEQADGSPKPNTTRTAVEPAPGTFGFDHSKYRSRHGDDVSLDDFGLPLNDTIKEEETELPPTTEPKPSEYLRESVSSTPRPPKMAVPKSPSPLPFAHYAPEDEPPKVPKIMVTRSSTEHLQQMELDEPAKAGWCSKCVIM